MKILIKVAGTLLAAAAAELIRENMDTIKEKISDVWHRSSKSEDKVQHA